MVTEVEMSRKIVDHAEAGDPVTCFLRDIEPARLASDQVLSTPSSITAHTKFEAEVQLRTKEQRGRHTPLPDATQLNFYFRTTDVVGGAKLPEGTARVTPGDSGQLEVDLEQPIAVDRGLRFGIREGGRTIGWGVVTKILL
jgi:elongation factor Tu